MENVKVSVIMPAYNAQRFIEEAIRSVQKQTVEDWELLVIDDNSTDRTCEIVEQLAKEDPRIILLKNEHNVGPAQSRNHGLEVSCGKYVAFLDSDDFWYEKKLEKQLALAEKRRAGLVYSSYDIVDEEGKPDRSALIVPKELSFEDLLKNNVIGCSTVLLSKRAALLHRFQLNFYHEDYIMWLELLQEGFRACGCTEVLVGWRYMKQTRSGNKWNSALMRWKIYRDYLHFPFLKSVRYFAQYAISGFRKYSSRS